MFLAIEVITVCVRLERNDERVCSKWWTTLVNVDDGVDDVNGVISELYMDVNVCLLSCESIPYIIMLYTRYIYILYIVSNLQIQWDLKWYSFF